MSKSDLTYQNTKTHTHVCIQIQAQAGTKTRNPTTKQSFIIAWGGGIKIYVYHEIMFLKNNMGIYSQKL